MADYEIGEDCPTDHTSACAVSYSRDWPYIAMLVLAILGSPIRISHGRQ